MKGNSFKKFLSKTYKFLFCKFVKFVIDNKINDDQAVCIKKSLLNKKGVIKFMLHTLISPRQTKENTTKFLNVLKHQAIKSTHLKKRNKLFKFAQFQILSGYATPGKELEKAVFALGNNKFNHLEENNSNFKYKLPGNSPLSITTVVFRAKFEEAKKTQELLHKHTFSSNNCQIKTFYSQEESSSSFNKNNQQNTTPLKVTSSSNIFTHVCEDSSIDEDELILFNFSDTEHLFMQLAELEKQNLTNKNLVILQPIHAIDTPHSLRKPERALSFACRKSLLKQKIRQHYIHHPLLLMAALWSQTLSNGNHKIIKYYPPLFDAQKYQCELISEAHFFDRLATRVFSEALLRQDCITFSGLGYELPYFKTSLPLSIEKEDENIEISQLLPQNNQLDVLLVTDFRIRGGGVNSVLEEAKIIKQLGLKVGVMHLDAITYNRLTVSFTQNALSELAKMGIPLFNGLPEIHAKLVIVRYPPVLVDLPDIIPYLKTEKAVIVVNQPPKRLSHEKAFYDPIACHQNGISLFQFSPEWWANGEDAKQAMLEYAKDLPLSPTNWLNVITTFADESLINKRTERIKDQEREITLGRHTRDVINKWPSTPQSLLQCYPEDYRFSVNILGGAKKARRVLSYLPENWKIWSYGKIDVQDYLEDLDFFVFFPHEERIEAMARCIVEAMASGLPVILPNKFRGYYGDTPIYCETSEVIPTIQGMINNPEKYKEKCLQTLQEAQALYGAESMARRLQSLGIELPSKSQIK